MLRLGMVGLGKMGLSHHAIVNAHPGVKVVAACNQTAYLTDVLTKYTGLKCYDDYDKMLAAEPLDAVIIATPLRMRQVLGWIGIGARATGRSLATVSARLAEPLRFAEGDPQELFTRARSELVCGAPQEHSDRRCRDPQLVGDELVGVAEARGPDDLLLTDAEEGRASIRSGSAS